MELHRTNIGIVAELSRNGVAASRSNASPPARDHSAYIILTMRSDPDGGLEHSFPRTESEAGAGTCIIPRIGGACSGPTKEQASFLLKAKGERHEQCRIERALVRGAGDIAAQSLRGGRLCWDRAYRARFGNWKYALKFSRDRRKTRPRGGRAHYNKNGELSRDRSHITFAAGHAG